MWYFCGVTPASFLTHYVIRMSPQEREYREKPVRTSVREVRDGHAQEHRGDACLHMGLLTHTPAMHRAAQIWGLKVETGQTSRLNWEIQEDWRGTFLRGLRAVATALDCLLQQPVPFSAEYTHAYITLPFLFFGSGSSLVEMHCTIPCCATSLLFSSINEP